MAADPKKSFLLRIDPKLWAEVERWSAEELRSVNGQIEFILRDAVRRRRGPGAAGPDTAGSGLPDSEVSPGTPPPTPSHEGD